MSVEVQTQVEPEQKQNDKELNFRAFEAKKNKEIEAERAERFRLQKELEDLKQRINQKDEEEDYDPYIDTRRLEKKLARFGQQTEEKTTTKIQQAVQEAIYTEKKQAWLDANPDFYDVMENNVKKLMEKAPEISKSILSMPDNFERQKLVYNTIKTMGLDKPEQKSPSIQDKVDANRRSPYYQPSSMGTAPYAPTGDFSDAGKKRAYEEMQKLKQSMRG